MNPGPSDTASTLNRFLADLAPAGVAVAYLFGSHAEGTSHRESDVDLGVVFQYDKLPTSRDRFEAGIGLASELTGALAGRPVDLVVLNDAPPGLSARVATGGLVVFCADPSLEHAFRRDAQLRAADLEPFLRRTRRIKLEALDR